ncbi:uncharacterized protein LOC124945125 [Impatiens glandulifera]|uniref:uncharacterized protein LOC124945125 n=1 Tax=Impatiens glandulifera TaxID=253017 RepID=UPI001FB08F13|nr:uncharacterized protein LOC124945125 [Impatiens glandulifera]
MMERPSSPSSTSGNGSPELQCVGRLEIVKPKPVGFLCGSIPIVTDKSFLAFNSALVPTAQTLSAPQYRVLPNETDLNTPPMLSYIPEKVLPIAAACSRTSGGDSSWENSALTSSLTRKGEALAVSGLAEYGDEMDIIAPTEILKQIFKIPYSKARLSIAVRRIGQTLVLNTGPDVEEGEKLVRRHKSKCAVDSLFLNFAMHSVRMEACDCPPTHNVSSKEMPKSSFLPRPFESVDGSFKSSKCPTPKEKSESGMDGNIFEEEQLIQKSVKVKHDSFLLNNKNKKKNKECADVKKAPHVKEKSRSSMQEPEKYRRLGKEVFSRILFWQFHNFRMLLGSDLLLFSNEKYVAVSLHLWDVSRQVTSLTWLEAWLDNVMASVPELAICYHQDGVVQGYELLKTDDIFLSKGVSEDGMPAFHPHVVQQNGLSVLRFLQENCKQDPGAYWLYKSSGEDAIQLFDLSVITNNCSTGEHNGSADSLPSMLHRGRNDSLLSLGTLLYRIAHRLSLSMSPNNRTRCAMFFRKCLDFLDEPDHLVVRALAHEQYARLLLNYDEELELASEGVPVESKVVIVSAEEESFDYFNSKSESIVRDMVYAPAVEEEWNRAGDTSEDLGSNSSLMTSLEVNISTPNTMIESQKTELIYAESESRSDDEGSSVCELAKTSADVIQTIVDPISSKLAAVHHVSQAIKSLRWKRQLQSTSSTVENNTFPSAVDFSICDCGDADCIEVCDIRKWLPTSKLDDKLWKLVLLLGETYLALGQCYKDDDQLYQALKIVELASLVYGSMPQYREDTTFVSSMICSLDTEPDDAIEVTSNLPSDCFSSTYLFWARAWTLVGDIYIEFHMTKGQERKMSSKELKMSSMVLKEVKRLKKKLGQFGQDCSLCSLINCSCQVDRANSGSNASSSSNGGSRLLGYGKKQNRKVYGRNSEPVSIFSEQTRTGGIFKFLSGPPIIGDSEYNLSAALVCYEEAKKALGECPDGSSETQSLLKKRGWVCNELGRKRLENKELEKAEIAFMDAIISFKEVSDVTNVVLIYCNMGHGRRSLAEEMVSRIEALRKHVIYRDAYVQALETAKIEYRESLRYYVAGKMEVTIVKESEMSSLKSEVITQLAHTYLRLGMLLAREDTKAEVYDNFGHTKNTGKKEVSANDVIREALSLYESMGELRKQEAAYGYMQLAGYHRDCCLKFLGCEKKKTVSKSENGIMQKVKQYASLAERNWQKSIDFYRADTHPMMHLTILVERAALSLSLSDHLHSHGVLDSAFGILLEARHISGETIAKTKMENENDLICSKFWSQLQLVLKRMLSMALSSSSNSNKSSSSNLQQQSCSSNHHRSGDASKLKELYLMALTSSEFAQLRDFHHIWIS